MYGAQLRSTDVTCPGFADDMTNIALYKAALNALLKLAHDHSVKWRYDFNLDKTVYMLWGNDECPSMSVMLGDQVVKHVKSCKHVGIMLKSGQGHDNEIYEDRITAARKLMFSARGIGSHNVPVVPDIMSKIYWSIVIPKMTYGLEVTQVSEQGFQLLEKAHKQNAKMLQGLPQNTPSPGTMATIGWLSIKRYIEMRKLVFLWQMLYLPMNNIYRRVVVATIGNWLIYGTSPPQNSPMGDSFNVACKYGMREMVRNCIMSNVIGSIDSMKACIKNLMWKQETMEWRATCSMYPELRTYSATTKIIQVHAWWKLAHRYPQLFKEVSSIVAVLLGVQPKFMQRNLENIEYQCGLCHCRCKENAMHVILQCSELEDIRSHAWDRLLSSMPPGMRQDIRNDEKTLELLLSGLGGNYIPEWDQTYANIAQFVYSMYEHRKHMYDRNVENTG